MKNCPKCNEIIGDRVSRCFNCNYNFELGRIPTSDEVKTMSKLVEEKRQQDRIERERLQNEYQQNRRKNALYEYEVVVLRDQRNGCFDVEAYRNILATYAAQGWRLKNVFANEIGKNATTLGIGGAAVGTNATMDNTIITFERCIQPDSF